MAAERTLVLIKPDAMQRALGGEILARFERRGLGVRAAKLLRVDRELAERHYAEHVEKPFFGELVEFITSAPTLALVLEGESAIGVVRTTMGATNPTNARMANHISAEVFTTAPPIRSAQARPLSRSCRLWAGCGRAVAGPRTR